MKNSKQSKLDPQISSCNHSLHFFPFSCIVPDKENLTTKWSEWTPCSKTCGDAKRKRIEYRCTSSYQEIRDCAVSGLQHEACVFKACPGKCIDIKLCFIQDSDLYFTTAHFLLILARRFLNYYRCVVILSQPLVCRGIKY